MLCRSSLPVPFSPVLDFNVVNPARPIIRRDRGAASSDVQFVISAYAATYAVFLITGGRLGDWLGRKRMFMLGVAGFTLASVLCGTAWSPSILIAACAGASHLERGRARRIANALAECEQVRVAVSESVLAAVQQARSLSLLAATPGEERGGTRA